jgi:4-amino-4-deoxy-L-arabinose transferase-like glycosyltransferase
MDKRLLGALAVLAFGAIVRLWGVQHDLPHSYYPDELHFVQRAVSFGSGDFNPHWFHKPALYMYLLFLEYGGYFCAGLLLGFWGSVPEFALSFIQDTGPFILIGRLTTVLFSVGCLVAVYRIGEKHFAKHVGLVAALLLSLVVGHVQPSRWVKADVPAAFFAIWSVYFLLNYLKDGRWKAVSLAAVLAAMGAATKYYPVVMLLPISIATLVGRCDSATRQSSSRRRRQLSVAIVLFCVVFFVCSPYNLLDTLGREQTLGSFGVTDRLQRLVAQEATTGPDAHINEQTSLLGGAVDYVGVLFSKGGMGSVIALVSLAGLFTILRRDLAACVFLVYPLVLAVLSVSVYPGYAEARHQCTIYPFLAICGGAFVVAVANWKPQYRRVVYATLCLALIAPLTTNLQLSAEILKTDSRTVAKEWIEETIPSGTRLLVTEQGPALLVSKQKLEELRERSRAADEDGQFTAHYGEYLRLQSLAAEKGVSYDCDVIRLPWWREMFDGEVTLLDSEYDKDMGNPLKPVGVFSYDYYVEHKFQYAIVHSYEYEDFLTSDSEDATSFPTFHRFYSDLFAHGNLVKEFSPDQSGGKGPVVRVYRITPRGEVRVSSDDLVDQ